jgi:CHAT domain-containing protein
LVIPAMLSPLPLHAARTQTPAGWRHFIDDWALTTAPSLSAYRLSRRRRTQREQGPASLLQVVDPRSDFGVRAIPVVPGFTSRTSLNGPEATVESVLRELPRHSHLLFYCHGSWDWKKPEDSALLLAAEGRLTVRQLRDAAAKAGRAAILAACETALNGLDIAPDEFTGLPAALLEAGIPGVAASLWPVASGPTLLLCDRLLRNLSTPGVSMAAALRDAQLWLRDTQGYQELYFWAAFTATGV